MHSSLKLCHAAWRNQLSHFSYPQLDSHILITLELRVTKMWPLPGSLESIGLGLGSLQDYEGYRYPATTLP